MMLLYVHTMRYQIPFRQSLQKDYANQVVNTISSNLEFQLLAVSKTFLRRTLFDILNIQTRSLIVIYGKVKRP